MAVARSYENYEIQGEPFKESNRWYVNIKMPKGIKKVRWYSDAERAAQDRKAGIEETNSFVDFNARHAFGFGDLGYITLYKGDESVIKEWAQREWPPKAWYNLLFRFFTPSEMKVEDVPASITPIKLTWDEVKLEGHRIKPYKEVTAYVQSLIGEGNPESQFQGAEGDWIQKTVTVVKVQIKNSNFGEKKIFTMTDKTNNHYQWETSTKNYENGAVINLKMKVKAHETIGDTNTTIVWYCKEIK